MVELRLTGRVEPTGQATSRRDKTPLGTIEGIGRLQAVVCTTQTLKNGLEGWMLSGCSKRLWLAVSEAMMRQHATPRQLDRAAYCKGSTLSTLGERAAF